MTGFSSKNKDAVAKEIDEIEPKPEYEKIIKDPYVLEFLNLEANPHFLKKIKTGTYSSFTEISISI